MKTLPRFIPINLVRQTKDAIFATLSPKHVEILDLIAKGGSVYGSPKGGNFVLLVLRGKVEEKSEVIETSEVVELHKAGWLRYAKMPMADSGYFWLTPAAERVWDVLKRGK